MIFNIITKKKGDNKAKVKFSKANKIKQIPKKDKSYCTRKGLNGQ